MVRRKPVPALRRIATLCNLEAAKLHVKVEGGYVVVRDPGQCTEAPAAKFMPQDAIQFADLLELASRFTHWTHDSPIPAQWYHFRSQRLVRSQLTIRVSNSLISVRDEIDREYLVLYRNRATLMAQQLRTTAAVFFDPIDLRRRALRVA